MTTRASVSDPRTGLPWHGHAGMEGKVVLTRPSQDPVAFCIPLARGHVLDPTSASPKADVLVPGQENNYRAGSKARRGSCHMWVRPGRRLSKGGRRRHFNQSIPLSGIQIQSQLDGPAQIPTRLAFYVASDSVLLQSESTERNGELENMIYMSSSAKGRSVDLGAVMLPLNQTHSYSLPADGRRQPAFDSAGSDHRTSKRLEQPPLMPDRLMTSA